MGSISSTTFNNPLSNLLFNGLLTQNTIGLNEEQKREFFQKFFNNEFSLGASPIQSQGIVSGLASGLLNSFFDAGVKKIALEKGLDIG
ncbi:MAG: hypothetical protein ACR2NW_07775 [Thermodesulfobacteriota bacterium]